MGISNLVNFRKLIPSNLKLKIPWVNIRTCFNFLSTRDKYIIMVISGLQFFLTFLDIVAVGLIGIIGSLSIRGIQSQGPGERVSLVLDLLRIQNRSLQIQVVCIGLLAVLFFVSKTLASIWLTTKTLKFLSNRSAALSTTILESLFAQPLSSIRKQSSQELLFAATSGANAIMLGIIATIVNAISDIALLVGMSLALIMVDVVTTLLSLLIFIVVSFAMYKMLHKKAQKLGKESSDLNILSNTLILELLGSYRDFLVRNRRFFALERIRKIRFSLADISAKQNFLPNINKYVMESLLIVGTFSISVLQFTNNESGRAVGTLTIFLAAGTRVAPAFLRIQQGALSLKISLEVSKQAIGLLSEAQNVEKLKPDLRNLIVRHDGFKATIAITNVSFSYKGSDIDAISNVDFIVKKNEKIAIVGPSGSGKSTLGDLILGVINPKSGEVLISGMSPLEAISQWPGAIGYVPQEISLNSGTILENICLGFASVEVPEKFVWDAIELAQLDKFIHSLPSGLATQIGDGFQGLSGGQRQRIGIARAILSKPRLLLLDEATSSLDLKMEKELIRALDRISKEMTVVIITHRKGILKLADRVIHLNKGQISRIETKRIKK